jgi:hypothetical protein
VASRSGAASPVPFAFLRPFACICVESCFAAGRTMPRAHPAQAGRQAPSHPSPSGRQQQYRRPARTSKHGVGPCIAGVCGQHREAFNTETERGPRRATEPVCLPR